MEISISGMTFHFNGDSFPIIGWLSWGFYGYFMGTWKAMIPSGYVKIAETGPVEIVDLPIKNGGFP